MTPKLTKENRLKIIQRVENGESVAKVCSEVGISRVLFYRWYKKYKKEGLSGLNPGEAGRPEEVHAPKKPKEYTILSPHARSLMVKEVTEQKQEASEVAKRYNISRVTLYKWIARYKNDIAKGYEPDMASKRPYIERYFRQVPEKHELAVIQLVGEHPEWGIRRIVANLPKVGGMPIVGHHGVQNILDRHNLSTYEERLNYAKSQITPVTEEINGVLVKVSDFFRIPPEKRQTFIKAFGVISVGSFSLVIILGAISLIAHSYSQAPGTSVVGLIFAMVALFMGMIFLVYSFKYYFSIAMVLSFSQGQGKLNKKRGIGLTPDLSHVKLNSKPYVSVQIPFYNEKYVVERSMQAAINFDYPEYEVILCDDSTDETTNIIANYLKANAGEVYKKTGEGWELTWGMVKKGVTLKHLHRTTRGGYKGGALDLALKLTNPRTEYISIFDADFVPYPDTLELFLKYFQVEGNKPEVAAVQGYQWHVLNKSENWITRGVRTEYAGSYVIERSGIEIYGGLKQISGSVYMIKKNALEEIGWGTSITEDFELTLRLYAQGYKVLYTPYIQAPAECVSTIRRLVRQRMRWAEGHSFNVKQMFMKLVGNPKLSLAEKFEFVYLSPYYLQAFFFLVGTFCWLLSESVFGARLPFWTQLWGWSLVLTNMISLPLLNAVGMFLEESGERDYLGLASFIALSYVLVPFQAYAAVKGLIEKKEGPWFRTPKTGRITDVFRRGKFYKFISGILPGKASEPVGVAGQPVPQVLQDIEANFYLNLATANNRFNDFGITRKKSQYVGKAFLAGLLILSNLVISMAPGIPYFVKPTTVQAESFSTINSSDKNKVQSESLFPNGVLVLNTDKSYYAAGEKAFLQIGVLDKNGDTECNADIELKIYTPEGSTSIFKTSDQTIDKSITCQADNNVTDNSDYFVNYKVGVKGVYKYDLINSQNGYTVNGSFEVKNSSSINVERMSATRINPFKSDYVMNITLAANKNVSGKVSEAVPAGFVIENGGTSWNVNLKKGETETLSYTYQAPKISPDLFVLGPLTLSQKNSITTLETTGWQLASDGNTCTAAASGAWSAAATWASPCNTSTTTPGYTDATDTVTIPNAAYAVTVDVNRTVGSISFIGGTLASSITVNSGITLSVTGAVTINAPTAAVTKSISAGSGTLTIGGLTTITGGASSFYIALLTASTGTLNINGGITFGGTPAQAQFTTSGIATIKLTGTLGIDGTLSMYQGTTLTTTGTSAVNLAATTWGLITVTSGALTLGAAATCTGITITSGTLTLGAAITVNGNFANNSSTSAYSGNFTTTFSGTGRTIGGTYATTFYALTLSASATVTANTNFTVSNALTFTSTTAALQSLTLGSSSVTATLNTVLQNQPGGAYTSYFYVNAGTVNESGVYTIPSTSTTTTYIATIVITTGTFNANGGINTTGSTGGSTAAVHVINMSGSTGTFKLKGAIQTVSVAGAGGWTFTMGTSGSNFDYVDSAAQTVYMPGSGAYNNLLVDNTNASGATLNASITTSNVTGNISVGSLNSGSLFVNAAALAIAGTSGKTFRVYAGSTFNLTGTSTFPTGFTTFTFDSTSTVNYMETTATLAITLATYGNLGLKPAGTATQNLPAGTMTVAGTLTCGNGTNTTTCSDNANSTILSISGNLTISAAATFVAHASNAFNIAGNFTNNGTFTHSSGTVTLNGGGGTTQTIAGSSTFYNLTATATTARTIAFTDGTTQTITHSLTLTGASTQLITLQHTSSTTWGINTTGASTVSVSYVSVSYSSSTICITATNSTNGGNNHNWDFLGTGCAVNSTQYSFQRKTWYDGTRYWKSFATGSQIQFWYSPDGSSWTQNSSATITLTTSDFSIEADSGNAFIVYTSGYNTNGRVATSYPGTSFSWGSESTIFTGSSATNNYTYPVIDRDSSSYVWVEARYTGSSVYYIKTIHKISANNTLPADTGDIVYPISNTSNSNSNVFGNIATTLSQNMYSVFTVGTALQGCVWVNGSTAWQNTAGSSCANGANVDSIATLTSGISDNMSAVTDSSGNVHLTYIDSSGHTDYREYTSSAWQSVVTLDSNSGNSYTSITYDTSNTSIYTFWIRSGSVYYNQAFSPYTSGSWSTATTWKTGTNLTSLSSNSSGPDKIFAEWTSDSGEPYTVNWAVIAVPENLWFLFSLGIVVPFYAKKKRKTNITTIVRTKKQ